MEQVDETKTKKKKRKFFMVEQGAFASLSNHQVDKDRTEQRSNRFVIPQKEIAPRDAAIVAGGSFWEWHPTKVPTQPQNQPRPMPQPAPNSQPRRGVLPSSSRTTTHPQPSISIPPFAPVPYESSLRVALQSVPVVRPSDSTILSTQPASASPATRGIAITVFPSALSNQRIYDTREGKMELREDEWEGAKGCESPSSDDDRFPNRSAPLPLNRNATSGEDTVTQDLRLMIQTMMMSSNQEDPDLSYAGCSSISSSSSSSDEAYPILSELMHHTFGLNEVRPLKEDDTEETEDKDESEKERDRERGEEEGGYLLASTGRRLPRYVNNTRTRNCRQPQQQQQRRRRRRRPMDQQMVCRSHVPDNLYNRGKDDSTAFLMYWATSSFAPFCMSNCSEMPFNIIKPVLDPSAMNSSRSSFLRLGVNAAYTKLFGFSEEELIGTYSNESLLLNEPNQLLSLRNATRPHLYRQRRSSSRKRMTGSSSSCGVSGASNNNQGEKEEEGEEEEDEEDEGVSAVFYMQAKFVTKQGEVLQATTRNKVCYNDQGLPVLMISCVDEVVRCIEG